MDLYWLTKSMLKHWIRPQQMQSVILEVCDGTLLKSILYIDIRNFVLAEYEAKVKLVWLRKYAVSLVYDNIFCVNAVS